MTLLLFLRAEPVAYLRPDADVSDGSWTNELGSATDLFASVDDVALDDADYIQSSIAPVADICRLRLADPASGVGQPMKVRYRYKKDGIGTINLTVRLLQDVVTKAEWTHTDIADSFVTTTQTLSDPEFASITNFNDLFIELQADAA